MQAGTEDQIAYYGQLDAVTVQGLQMLGMSHNVASLASDCFGICGTMGASTIWKTSALMKAPQAWLTSTWLRSVLISKPKHLFYTESSYARSLLKQHLTYLETIWPGW